MRSCSTDNARAARPPHDGTLMHPVAAPRRFGARITASALARAMAFAVTGAALFAACTGTPQLHGVMVDPPREVAAFTFTRASGATFTTAPESGRLTVLFFGYTHCPDVCPTTLSDWKRAKTKLGADAAAVRFVFVSVDPARDTPAIAERYATQFDAAFTGLSGDSATTAGILAAFGASAAREGIVDSTHYSVAHAAQTFLLDDRGRIVAMYPLGIGWEALAADLATLR